MPKGITRYRLATCIGCGKGFGTHAAAQKYCDDCRKPRPPYDPNRICVDCGQPFRAGGSRQIRCKPCGASYRLKEARRRGREYYETNHDAVLARTRQRRIERANGAPLLKKGHPRVNPADPRDCLRCGADFIPNAANQKFCPPCGPLAFAELNKVRRRRFYEENKDLFVQRATEYNDRRRDDPEYRARKRMANHIYVAKVRRLVLGYYAGGKPQCVCCGEAEFDFLTIDHTNNDGARERRALKHLTESGINAGLWFYRQLIERGFPPGYQTLCYSCNCSKGKHGECAHKKLVHAQTQRNMVLDRWITCEPRAEQPVPPQASSPRANSSATVPLFASENAQSLLSVIESPRMKLHLYVHG